MSLSGGSNNKVEASPLELETAEISREKWERYKSSFRPVEKKYRERVADIGTKESGDAAASMAAASIDKNNTEHMNKVVASEMQGSGISARSGRAIGMRKKLINMGSSMKSAAQTESKSGQKDRFYGGVQNALSIGQGQAVTAQNSMEGLVDMAVQNQNQEAIADWNSSHAAQSAAIKMGTLGAMYYKNKG